MSFSGRETRFRSFFGLVTPHLVVPLCRFCGDLGVRYAPPSPGIWGVFCAEAHLQALRVG